MSAMPESFGKGIIILGGVLIFIGIFMLSGAKIPFLGKLPGDIYVQRENFKFYFPITTCVVISVLLYFIIRFFRR